MSNFSSVEVEGEELVLRVSFDDSDFKAELEYLMEKLDECEESPYYLVEELLRKEAGITDYTEIEELRLLIMGKMDYEDDTSSVDTSKVSHNNPIIRAGILGMFKKFILNYRNNTGDLFERAGCCGDESEEIEELIQSMRGEASGNPVRVQITAVCRRLGEYLDTTPRGQITRGAMKQIVTDNLAAGNTPSVHDGAVSSGLGSWSPK